MHHGTPASPPQPLRALLDLLSLGYKAVACLRLRTKARRRRTHPDLYIVSVDSLSFGGSGKTTLVRGIGAHLDRHDLPFAIVSRGYRGDAVKKGLRVESHHSPREAGDEAVLMKHAFPDRDVLIGRDRQRSIRIARDRGNRFVLLDDGFQSSDIAKDLSILLLNPRQPYHYLRHFRRLARRADIVLTLTEADLPDPPLPPPPRLEPGVPYTGQYAFRRTGFHDPADRPVAVPPGTPLFGVSALGDNHRFRDDLARLNLVGFRGFADHFAFEQAHVDRLDAARRRAGARHLVCTEKDIVKLRHLDLGDIPFLYARNEIQFNFDLYSFILSDAGEKGFI